MSFQVPQFSSSPPSTPERRPGNGNYNVFGASNPSTTPAGPPPSSTGSFTPAGPPPSSFLGSSMLDVESPVKPLPFSQKSSFGLSSTSSAAFARSPDPPQNSHLRHEYQASPAISSQGLPYEGGEYEDERYSEQDDRSDDNEEPYGDNDADAMTYNDAHDEDAQYDRDEDMVEYDTEVPGLRRSGYGYNQSTGSDLLLSTGSALRQSSATGFLGARESRSAPSQPSMYAGIAKTLYIQMGVPEVDEDDELVLRTEAAITRLYEEGIGASDNEDRLLEILSVVPDELQLLWAEYDGRIAVHNSEEYTATIGPGPKALKFAKANFLGSIALQSHRSEKESGPFGVNNNKPLPSALLEWMDQHHNYLPSQLEEVQSHRPSPAGHRMFWDAIYACLLRGKVVDVINTMNNAGWRNVRISSDNPRDFSQTGLTGVALSNVEKVINAATEALSLCPATRGDWNTRGGDWALFRHRASQALEDLRRFNEGRAGDQFDFGNSSAGQSGTYSRTAQKAQSQVPWDIYQRLETLYSLMRGDHIAIIECSTDWTEATIALLVWWDDVKEDRRLALGRSRYSDPLPKENDSEVYLRKLRKSFQTATADGTDFQVNSIDEVELGLASLFERDYESVIGFLRGWSGPVSAAVAEIASLGGWLPRVEEKSLMSMESLDQEDLDLLGLGSSPSRTDGVKDETLITYARSLSLRGPMTTSTSPRITRVGWELTIAVLGRLDSTSRSEEMIEEFLQHFDLDTSETVDKLWRLLNDLAMSRHAEDVAKTYADLLAEGSHRYGEALWYYALSHKAGKVKDVLDLLISYSLLYSAAFPPEEELDDHLRNLVATPKIALTELASMDTEAAELLHRLLSGYATLRKFYILRDEGVLAQSQKSQTSLLPRRLEAASSLVAVISSSDDNITGGLFDESRGAVVSVDFLLALLGEALVFVNQPNSTITLPQIDVLLKAIEDLQAVGPRVYTACTEFLQTVIASGQTKGSSPTDMLRKSTSATSGSSFSLVGSSMLASQMKQSMGSSGVMVKGNVKRGWDWRHTVSASTTGDDVLRILRLGLAKDLAKVYLMEADNNM